MVCHGHSCESHTLWEEQLAQLTVQTFYVPSLEMTFALQCAAEGLYVHFQSRHTECRKDTYWGLLWGDENVLKLKCDDSCTTW